MGQMKSFGNSAFQFLRDLKLQFKLPNEVSCLMPFEDPEVLKVNKLFFRKYYNDQFARTMIIGINPGRFGAGITGISFTDPVKLENVLEIKNSFVKRSELSSDFVYKVINDFGGPDIFYEKFYVTAVSPIGFVKNGKNINYYDDNELCENLNEFIVHSLKLQISFGVDTSFAYCLGEGENFKYLKKLNDVHQFFDKIIPLPHPRFIMQYRRKQIDDYIQRYLNALKGNLPHN